MGLCSGHLVKGSDGLVGVGRHDKQDILAVFDDTGILYNFIDLGQVLGPGGVQVFLALGNALWSLLMAAVQIVYWMAMLLLFPMSVLALALLGFVPVTVFCQQIAWRIMDKVFGLEDQFRKKREAELAEGMQE